MKNAAHQTDEMLKSEPSSVPVIEPERYKALMQNFGSSVAVITVSHEGKDHGMTATAICSVSAAPPQILIVINRSNRSHAVITAAKRFTVNVLADHQADIGRRFSEKHLSPFEGIACTRGQYGGPVLSGCAAFLECQTTAEFEVDTHTIFVASVVHGDAMKSLPLLYHAGSYKSLVGRTADYSIANVFTSRWSPRSFDETEISDHELLTFLEAARWAPSAMNEQPWRFVVTKRSDHGWFRALDVLSKTNQIWAVRAAALIVMVSKATTTYEDVVHEAPTHQFDNGAAWMSFALQAHLAGWHTHAMAGFDRDRARSVFAVPDDYRVNAIVAVGKQGIADALPPALKDREVPSDRRPLKELVSREIFETPFREA